MLVYHNLSSRNQIYLLISRKNEVYSKINYTLENEKLLFADFLITDPDVVNLLSSGKCLFYNNLNMSVYLTIVTCAAKCGAVLCFVLALYTSKWCEIPEDPDVDVEVPSRKQTAQEFVSTRKLTR